MLGSNADTIAPQQPQNMDIQSFVHKSYSFNNKNLILKSNKCYCFHCLKSSESKEIIEYTSDNTAICPKCGIDSILPDILFLDENFINKLLREMSYKFFEE